MREPLSALARPSASRTVVRAEQAAQCRGAATRAATPMVVTGTCARQTFSGHDIEDMGINVYGKGPLPSDPGMEAPAFPNGFADYAKAGARRMTGALLGLTLV